MSRTVLVAMTMAAAMASSIALSSSPAAAADTPMQRVLGMKVEGMDLTQKDRDDLFRVVQAKLRSYPQITLLKPPERELMDEMMDLECIDVDIDCLTKLGKKYNAEKVFYAQVDPDGAAFTLIVRVVDVGKTSALRDEKTSVAVKAGLANALESNVEAVFGQPPAPVESRGTLEVVASVAGAKIFVGGEYAGTGSVRLKKDPGSYSVRVTREGFEEQIFNLTVTAGQLTTRAVDLKEAAGGPVGVGPNGGSTNGKGGETKKDEGSVFEEAWFWGVIVGVVALGTTVAVVATSGGDDTGDSGRVVFSVDPQNAWQDGAVLGAGGN